MKAFATLAARGSALAAALVAALSLGGCVSVDVGKEPAPQVVLSLRDATTAPVARLAAPVVPALLIQPRPGSALADTGAIAFSRRADEYAFYQYATWTERPVRQLPHLLQQRLQERGVATAVGLLGDPMQADWVLAVAVDTIYHDVSTPPGVARLALSVELFDRRNRRRVAQARFEASQVVAEANSLAAVQALSRAVARTFDELQPWLETELTRAAAK